MSFAARKDVTVAASAMTRKEVEKTRDSGRRSELVYIVDALEQLPWQIIEASVGGLNSAALNTAALNGVVLRRHSLLTSLEDLFDTEDALHIAQARLSGCDFFLTLDRTTILSRRSSMTPTLRAALEPLEICDPVEIIARLARSDQSAGQLTNVAADKHFSDAASPQWLYCACC
ncbi:MAG TPA: hypothetical protein VIM21_00580 [Gemmatimonadaceae bacterium]